MNHILCYVKQKKEIWMNEYLCKTQPLAWNNFLYTWRVDALIKPQWECSVELWSHITHFCMCESVCVSPSPQSSSPARGCCCEQAWWQPRPPCLGPGLPLRYWGWAMTHGSETPSASASDEIWEQGGKKRKKRRDKRERTESRWLGLSGGKWAGGEHMHCTH